MIVSSYGATFYFLYLISGWGGAFSEKPKFDVDEFDYQGEPIGISCLYSPTQTEFHQIKVIGTNESQQPYQNLIKGLNNGKMVSFYVDGIGSHVKPNGSTFKFAKIWFTESNSSICYITYAYEKVMGGPLDKLMTARDMLQTHRLHYAAKVTRNLYLNIRKKCVDEPIAGCKENTEPKKVTMLGHSFGAYVASQACIYISKSTGKTVGRFVGIDPAGLILLLRQWDQPLISKSDALYVQIIHTDPTLQGTSYKMGHVDIDVVNVPTDWLNLHGFSVYLHMATAMNVLVLVAEENGDGRVLSGSISGIQHDAPRTNEVLLGVYSEADESKWDKPYRISFHGNRLDRLRSNIAHVVRAFV